MEHKRIVSWRLLLVCLMTAASSLVPTLIFLFPHTGGKSPVTLEGFLYKNKPGDKAKLP